MSHSRSIDRLGSLVQVRELRLPRERLFRTPAVTLRNAVVGLLMLCLVCCGGSNHQQGPQKVAMNSRVLWGMFQDRYPPDYSMVSRTSAQLEHPTQIVHAYYNWDDNPRAGGAGSAGTFVSQAHSRGQIPLVTWEAWRGNGAGYSLPSIASGADDATIDRMARVLAAQKGDIWLRVFHEFNDPYDPAAKTGYPWSVGGGTQNTPEQLVAAWRHIYERFHADGATNVRFVWTPDGNNLVDRVPLVQAAYPGDAYVDYTGWDSYDDYPNQSVYGFLAQLAPTKQAVISELGASNAQIPSLKSLADSINGNHMPLVRAAVWFDQGDTSLQSNIAVVGELHGMLSGPAFRTSS